MPQALDTAGFKPRTETYVMTRAIAPTSSPPLVELHDRASDDIWSPLQESAPNLGDAAERRGIVERITAPHVFGLIRLDGKPAAVGLGVRTGDWLGIYLMRTAPWARRLGFARDIVQALMRWGASNGATHTYLQVEASNEVAVALYIHEGFDVAYRYRYWARSP